MYGTGNHAYADEEQEKANGSDSKGRNAGDA
jgi:hypothetical protein